ncbi:hypothetical protein CTI12_AA426430 [Artemisia annua]|uniref:Uncharacterized protein n=1 Tax=Artemisia annua TaxID=35608 RepID=A0A2U1M2A3_ARTAN|nr:hypothetical protein CTI12_AA426430 [Artemisia annua]
MCFNESKVEEVEYGLFRSKLLPKSQRIPTFLNYQNAGTEALTCDRGHALNLDGGLDSYAKDYPTVASKPVVAAALYTAPGYPATPFQGGYSPRVPDPKQGQGPHHR